MEAFVIIWLACAAVGYAIGNTKGKASQGAVLGLLLGLIGIIIIACMSESPQEKLRKQQMYGAAPAYGPGHISAPVPPRAQAPSGWHADPYNRHESRFFDGYQWTSHVSNNGIQGVDAPVPLA